MRHETGWVAGLDGDRARTLALVLAGLTDEAAAHRLGVSKRTVQRRIRELMDLAGARNRMELGHRAALAGLPAPAPGAMRRGPHGAAEHRRERHAPAPAGPPAAETPDEVDLVLLRELLVDGAPAEALGVSTRSVERRVHDLMARAGAASRAQLGWHATRRGWL